MLLALLLPCQSVQARTLTDQVGRQVKVPMAPGRIVSLTPSLTEVVFELGAGELLVGVTKFATTPAAATKISKVGSYVHLDLERILRLKPDLCLAVRDGNPKHVVDRLVALGIPVYVVDPRSLAEVRESISLLGELLQRQAQAAKIVAEMEAIEARVAARVATVTSTPRVFFQIDASPIISAGDNTFIGQLIVKAGGINLAAGPTAYPRYSWENVLHLQPDVVLIASMSGGYTPEQLQAGWQKWPQVPAVAGGRIHVVEADQFDRPTLRLFHGLEQMVQLLHNN